jgi:hypothetical protein
MISEEDDYRISGWQLLLPANRILFIIGVIADVKGTLPE